MKKISPKTEYRVLRKLKSAKNHAIYLARCGDELVVLISVTEPETANAAELFFARSPDFHDLHEVARLGDELIVALSYIDCAAITLDKALKGLGLIERNRLALGLINEIRDSGAPWPVLCDVLRSGRIYALPGASVYFLYLLEIYDGYERDCRAEVMRLLSDVLEDIYEGEIHPALGGFLTVLRGAGFSSASELCDGFYGVYTLIDSAAKSALECDEPSGSLKDKLAELIGKLRDFVTEYGGTIIAIALLILGYIALGRALYNAIVNVPINGNLEAIGTVELYEESDAG